MTPRQDLNFTHFYFIFFHFLVMLDKREGDYSIQ
jgi:hypothetical protein